MKKIYLIGALFSLMLSSCSDFLDRNPSTSLPVEEAITSMSDLRNAVNGIHYLMSRSRMTYSADFAIYADLKGADFMTLSNVNTIGPVSKYTVTKKDDIPEYAYTYFYKTIANVNKALSAIDNVPYSESEKATFNSYKGQLYAWRAMLHFDLARMFCNAPTACEDINAANTGIVLATQVYNPGYVGARTTLKQTYDQILDDLGIALPLLTKAKTNGYINYWAALALRSRINLYYGKNSEALEDAKNVIASPLYKLYTMDNYVSAWGNEYTDESLFELNITTTYNAQRNGVGYYCDADGYGECAFNTSSPLFKYLTANRDDVRSKLVKDQTEAGDYAGYYPAKYPGRENSLYVNSPKIIRLSDVYLIAAEAAFKTGADATSYINDLRKNRIEGYTDVTSVTLDDILFERRIELFAEGSMAFDYWRNKMSVDNPYVGEVKYNAFNTILPIPQSEIDINPSILIQNPGY